MAIADASGLFVGAVVLGFIHGVEPGHGWPVAATYALDQSNKWLHGFAASFLLGFGHLVSSIAMVLVFFWAKEYFGITQIGWMNYLVGVLLIALGIREYFHGHSHSHGDNDEHHHAHAEPDHSHEVGHDHSHGKDEHSHDHDRGRGGVVGRIVSTLPFVGDRSHSHDHDSMEEASERGLWGIAGFAFMLGFAHEEEFEIIALCAGSNYCLELMVTYATTVIVGIVGLTLLLIAGYTHYEERAERYAEYLPLFSAVVLVGMGIGFIVGVF